MKFGRNFLLKSMHKDWYICQNREKDVHGSTGIDLDFYNGEPDVLERCTFLFQPIPQSFDKRMNCRNVVGPVVHPSITGQPRPRPPHLVPYPPPPVPAQPSCIPVCPASTMSGQQLTARGVPVQPNIKYIVNAEGMRNST